MTISQYTSALREVLLPYIRDNFPKDKILVDQMKRNAGVNFINDEFIAPIRTSRHGGVSFLADDDNTLVVSDGSRYSRGTVSTKILTGVFNITKLTMEATESSKGAIKSALQEQAEKLTSDFGRTVNRSLYGDGSGIITQARQTGGSVGAGTVAVEALGNGTGADDGRALDYYGTVNDDISPTKYFAVDNKVEIGTASAAFGTITSITGTSIVMTGAPAIAASDAVAFADGSGGLGGTSEFTGIKNALSSTTGTSTYAGLARTQTGWLPVFGSASEALTLKRMADTYLSAREYGRAGDSYVVLVNKSLFSKYGDILTAMRRTVDKADLLGGYKGLEFAAGDGNVGVFLDYDAPDGAVLILNLDTWSICQVNDLNWDDDPSAGGLLRLQNTLNYQAVMHWFANVICLAPAANGHQTRKQD